MDTNNLVEIKSDQSLFDGNISLEAENFDLETAYFPASASKPRKHRQQPVGGKWTEEEDKTLSEIVATMGPKNWKKISEMLGPTRSDVQCLHRWNKVLRPGLHKGPWSEREDIIVRTRVLEYGLRNVKWSAIAGELPGRIGKQCRERWFNHLDPSIKKGEWTLDEDRILFEAQKQFGNRWCEILKILPGRTENSLKNRWNSSTLKKWLRDNDLEPGNGVPIHDLSQGDTNYYLSVFGQALLASGIVSSIDTSLLDLNQAEEEDDEDEEENEERDLGATTTSSSSSSSSSSVDDKTAVASVENTNEESNTCSKPSSSSTMSRIPAHLRPPIIDTSPRDADGVEKTTERLIEMLHHLKNTPSPKISDASSRGKSSETSGTLKQKRPRVDPEVDPTNKPPNNCSSTAKKAKLPTTSGKKHNCTALIIDDCASMPRTELEPSSPTSKALNLLHAALNQSPYNQSLPKSNSLNWNSNTDTNISSSLRRQQLSEELVPFSLLPHFKWLNELAQRSLIRQLIERFQRTSITPKNAILATPRWSHGGILGLGVGIGINGPETPHLNETINPDCFASDDFPGLSPIASSSNALDELITSGLLDGQDPDKRRSKFKGVRLSHDGAASSPFNADDSAVEVAVTIALQIATKSSNSDKLLRILMNDESSVPFSTRHSDFQSSNREFVVPKPPSIRSRIGLEPNVSISSTKKTTRGKQLESSSSSSSSSMDHMLDSFLDTGAGLL